jgi:hypothetical protein
MTLKENRPLESAAGLAGSVVTGEPSDITVMAAPGAKPDPVTETEAPTWVLLVAMLTRETMFTVAWTETTPSEAFTV